MVLAKMVWKRRKIKSSLVKKIGQDSKRYKKTPDNIRKLVKVIVGVIIKANWNSFKMGKGLIKAYVNFDAVSY